MRIWERQEEEIVAQCATAPEWSARDGELELRKRLSRLHDEGACVRQAPWWVESKKDRDGSFMITVSPSADGRLGAHPCIQLRELHALQDGARLAFKIDVSRRRQPAIAYTVGLVGVLRTTGQSWFARIDLGQPGQGAGKCSHPMLHGHVGHDPDALFQARVPLPWLLPWDALDWLLTTVHPRLEPCPHR